MGEESPGSAGQDAGEIPVAATQRQCHRKETACQSGKGERTG
jgi:hypothetical protein